MYPPPQQGTVSSQCSSSITTSVWTSAYHCISRQHDTNTRESAPSGFPTPSFRAYQQPGPDSSIPIASITTTVTPFIPHLHKRRRYSMLDNILFPPTALPGPAFPSCELQLPISTQDHQPSVQPYLQRTLIQTLILHLHLHYNQPRSRYLNLHPMQPN